MTTRLVQHLRGALRYMRKNTGFAVVAVLTLAREIGANTAVSTVVGVARAVIHKPAFPLADEPTGNLHSRHAKEIMELFRGLNQQGPTIVHVTHSETKAAYGTRTIQLPDGWLVGDTANPTVGQVTRW
jgi:ABC-type sugar transport system ATPase subunit